MTFLITRRWVHFFFFPFRMPLVGECQIRLFRKPQELFKQATGSHSSFFAFRDECLPPKIKLKLEGVCPIDWCDKSFWRASTQKSHSAFGDAPDILSVFTVSFLSCKYFCGPQIKVLRQLPLTFQRRKPPRGSIRNVPCRQFQRGGKPEGVKGKREEMMIIWDLPSPPVFLRPGPLLGPCPPLYPHLP